jgi:hypothetical protein
MRSRKPLLVTVASLATAAAYLHAGGFAVNSTPLFKADFDSSTSQLVASFGKIYAFVTDQQAVSIEADVLGNKLVIDDSFTSSGLATAIACGFKDNAIVKSGIFEFSYEVNVSSSQLPFETGIVIDSPQSDMVPATGPDEDGGLILGNEATQTLVPANQDLQVSGSYSRTSESDDWKYSLVVTKRDPITGTETFVADSVGRVAGSAGKPIVGLAFRKLSGGAGVATIDEIDASVAVSVTTSIKR